MPTINDLKNADVIDTSKPGSVLDGIPGQPTTQQRPQTPVQQAMSNVRVRPQVQTMAAKPKQVIKKDINEDPSEGTHVVNKKTVVTPKPIAGQQQPLAKAQTTIADLSSLPTEAPGEEKIPVKTPAQQILEGDNSPLANYLKEKEQYYAEKDAQDAEEDALNENDAEINGVITDNVSDDDLGLVESEDLLEGDDFSIGTDSVKTEEIDIMDNTNTVDDDDADLYEDTAPVTQEVSAIDNSIDIEEEEENISATDENISTLETDDEEEETVEDKHPTVVEDETPMEVPDPTQEEVIEKLKKLASEKIIPVSKKLDLSTYTIVKKPTANTKFLNENPVKVAKWVLPTQQTIVKMKEMTGSELELIREFNEDPTSVSSMTKKYRCLYDHIASPKPSTFEAWCKSTPLTDIDHYFFGLYIAAFKGANFVPVDCQNKACKETYLTDDIPFMDMVKFETDDDKKKFNKIYQSEETLSNAGGLYTSELIPLSDRVAIEFRDFSLYSALELAGLDADFRSKHQNILYFVPHIDALYIINQEEGTLTPIGFKVFPDSPTKTAKSRILKYESVLNTLSADEFNIIRSYIASLGDHTIKMSYQYPQFECPKCHQKTEVIPMQAENMVFTRYQLATLVTTVLK